MPLGAERLAVLCAMALVGCATLAGIGSSDEDDTSTDGTTPPAPTGDPTAEAGAPGTDGAPTSTGGPTSPPTDASTTPPGVPNGSPCAKDSDCLSNKCAGNVCKKKGDEGDICGKAGAPCYEDDLCCQGFFCHYGPEACEACKGPGEPPDVFHGKSSCCSGTVGALGKCD